MIKEILPLGINVFGVNGLVTVIDVCAMVLDGNAVICVLPNASTKIGQEKRNKKRKNISQNLRFPYFCYEWLVCVVVIVIVIVLVVSYAFMWWFSFIYISCKKIWKSNFTVWISGFGFHFHCVLFMIELYWIFDIVFIFEVVKMLLKRLSFSSVFLLLLLSWLRKILFEYIKPHLAYEMELSNRCWIWIFMGSWFWMLKWILYLVWAWLVAWFVFVWFVHLQFPLALQRASVEDYLVFYSSKNKQKIDKKMHP